MHLSEFLPSYSPEINPLELLFNKFKTLLKKLKFTSED